MPYKTRAELPESVRHVLPAHAQDIYKDAFNSAYEEYGHDEARAHRVAWGAVKRKYHKDERTGKWVEGPSEDARDEE
ncbi:MAG: ChaB family protein [Thermomicrobiaceae bacterium]|nr:ChaB family protein [Thermomicrobiaceae bacterium]